MYICLKFCVAEQILPNIPKNLHFFSYLVSTSSTPRHRDQVVPHEIRQQVSLDCRHNLLEIDGRDGSIPVFIVLLERLNSLFFVEIVEKLTERVVVDITLFVTEKDGN